MKARLHISGAVMLGMGILLSSPSMAAETQSTPRQALPLAIADALSKPACDNVSALSSIIAELVAANPSLAADIASIATARCPDDAAAIATAAVNADPNGAIAVVEAVLAALPDSDKGNEVLTGAITPLYGLQPPGPPQVDGYGGPLKAPWTDPRHFTATDGTSSPR